MSGELLVNNLAGLLIVTSLMVIGAKKPKVAAGLYALQSLVLVFTFLAIAATFAAESLYEWALTAFITKVVLLPVLLMWAFSKMADPAADQPEMRYGWILLVGVVTVFLSFQAVKSVDLPLVAHLKPSAVGLSWTLLSGDSVYCLTAKYPEAGVWLLPDGKRCLSDAGTAGK